jgi:hypothetical protein
VHYPCKKISLEKLIMSHQGVVEPLCEHCDNQDCSNPIQTKTVAVFGITKQMKLYVIGDEAMAVIRCDGFIQ